MLRRLTLKRLEHFIPLLNVHSRVASNETLGKSRYSARQTAWGVCSIFDPNSRPEIPRCGSFYLCLTSVFLRVVSATYGCPEVLVSSNQLP